ncbi:hypothetical protein Tco_0229393, partial [Tanacetum coccineum]
MQCFSSCIENIRPVNVLVDANIRPVNDQVPSAEVHLTVPHNVLATKQYQAKSPLLKAELVKSKEMIEKETYNELSR